MTTTEVCSVKLSRSYQTRILLISLLAGGELLLACLFYYASFSQQLFVPLLMLCWALCGIRLLKLNHKLRGELWIGSEGDASWRRGGEVIIGQVERPFWYGEFACLLAITDEKQTRHWLWLAHDSMGRRDFSRLNSWLRGC